MSQSGASATAVSSAATSPAAAARGRVVGYHGAVSEFKRRLIEATLHQARGNRTHAARALGLQRTYLLRLIRDLEVPVPPPPPRRRAPAG
ncbi:MAG TPA: helix-turn-helix domain-containing protein [Candidatus Tectomicrobia bacterium]|nr:helix-turn-helix domain-containing protein [Candidatus Tectomicrobia bacterium]